MSEKIIGLVIEVHKALGPGLLESAYEQCLAYELMQSGIEFQRQKEISVRYKSFNLDCGYRLDMLVNNELILELKSVEKVLPIHEAQILTYMKLSHVNVGLLINFNSLVVSQNIKRFVL
ncbi:MAG: GxxExxY protein [Bacteroidota bacterium]